MPDRLNRVDTIEEVRTLPHGGRELRVRGRLGAADGGPIPLLCRFGGGASIRRGRASGEPLPEALRGVAVWDDVGEPHADADPEPILIRTKDGSWRELAADEDLPMEGTVRIRGIASSTGVDAYGTEMTQAALDNMAEQFSRPGATDGARGVAYAPTHAEREWMEVVGRTVGAEVRQVPSVLNAANASETAFVLEVDAEIDLGKRNQQGVRRGRQLVVAIRNGEEIGQSIGGWFLDVSYRETEDDTWRVLIHLVELDHLASTRSPANADSNAIEVVRGLVADALQARGLEPLAGFPTGGFVERTGLANVHHPPSTLTARQLSQFSQMLRSLDRRTWLRTFGGRWLMPTPGEIANATDHAAALRSGAIRPTGIHDDAGAARLASLYEDGFQARHVVGFEELDNAYAISWAKSDDFEGDAEMSSPTAEELSQLEQVDHRHVLAVEDEDDRITVWFAKDGEGSEEGRSDDTDTDDDTPEEERGDSLASFLNEQIDGMVDDDTSRSDIIQRMADAAGISASTVNQILNAEIDCPPIDRLEGFAEVLPASIAQIVSAAESDGCEYDDDRSTCCEPCTNGTGDCEADTLSDAEASEASSDVDASDATPPEEGDMPINDDDAAKLAAAVVTALRAVGLAPAADAAPPLTEAAPSVRTETAPAPAPATSADPAVEQLRAQLAQRDAQINALLDRPQRATGSGDMFNGGTEDSLLFFGPSDKIKALTTRASQPGSNHQLLARVVERDRNLKAMVEASEEGNETHPVLQKQLKAGLTRLIAGYRHGGGLSQFFPKPNTANRWR